MKKLFALIWLILSLAPILFIPYMMIGITSDVTDNPSESFDKTFNIVLYINILALVLIASFIAYIYHSDNVPKNKRGLWTVVLFLGHFIAMPFFWYWYVWHPINNNKQALAGQQIRPSRKIPILIGLAMILMMPMTIGFMKYKEAKSSDFFSKLFPYSNVDLNTERIPNGSISIEKIIAPRHTRYFRKTMSVFISDDSIVFKPSFSFSFENPFEIPFTAIHSCNKQCGGSTDYNLIFDNLGLVIEIENAPQILEWCWRNKIPVLSSGSRREWIYKGIDLPTKADLSDSLVSHEIYKQHLKRACQGY